MQYIRFYLIGFAMIGVVLFGCGSKNSGAAETTPEPVAAAEAGTTPEPDIPDVVIPGVAFDIYMMSKCPFAVKLLAGVIDLMEQMGDRVNLNIYYIGRIREDGLSSMHGDEEVDGDILQVCANALGGTRAMLQFIDCQNVNWEAIPEGWETCAATVGLDMNAMRSCYEGDRGRALLEASFRASMNREATGSPTMYLAGEPYNGGRSEVSMTRRLCSEMTPPKHPHCQTIPEPVHLPVTVVADERCSGRGCDPKRFLSFVQHTFEGADITSYDYGDPEGKALFERTGQQYLPVAVFGKDIVKEPSGYERLKRRLLPVEGSDDLVYPLGRSWDPTAEVCDDGIDNTGNGRVDCKDKSCQEHMACRKEMKGHLDLFVMSQCPYANRVLGVLGEVVDAFDRERSRMDLELVYIGQVKDGELTSMHGQAEVDEDKRQVCAQKYYRKNYKFLDYLACRSGNFEDDDWKSCAVDGIKASVISRCARGKEGKKLLKASFKKSETLGITGSPSWLLNNRHDMTGREPRDITSAFCERNAAVDGCAAITLEAEKKPDDTEDNAEADSPKPAPGAVYEGS